MKIRVINPSDIGKLQLIHGRYYYDEFEFPNFFHNYLSSFVVTNEEDKIITGGGVRLIAESVIITDKSVSARERKLALEEMFRASAFTASARDFKQLHAFIQDENWLRHLTKVGFRETVGKSLVLNL